MSISKRCQHGLKAAVQLAIRHEDGYVQARELAKTESLPSKFLEAVLLQMRLSGLLESKVGAGGGYRLTHPPAEVFVQELLDIFDTGQASGKAKPTDTPGGQAVSELLAKLTDAAHDAVAEMTLKDLVELAGA